MIIMLPGPLSAVAIHRLSLLAHEQEMLLDWWQKYGKEKKYKNDKVSTMLEDGPLLRWLPQTKSTSRELCKTRCHVEV